MKAFVSLWTNKGKKTWYLVAPSKVTLVFELSTFDDIPVLDTTSGAQILRGADQAGHKMEVDMQSHPHQIFCINLVAFIKRFLDVWFCNSMILRNMNALRRLWKTSRRTTGKTWGFEDSMDP